MSGASLSKTVGDAAVDVGIGAATIASGALASALVVTAGAPVLVGVSVGVSVAASYLLDGIKIGKGEDKQTISRHFKGGVQTVAGWFNGNKNQIPFPEGYISPDY
ncbi:hypothetical protein [Alkalihalobacterium chitinilyticum]|nr:hypothetical protein [Alkalihalobacterium chitinilyticum]